MILPSGTVTFLFTDIEASTKLWEAHPESMRIALARHDALLRNAIEGANGYVFKTVGDAFCSAFATAPEAVQAAIAAQSALVSEPWPNETQIKVRMALHTGSVESRDSDYFGPPVNRVARLQGIGHGGQILLSLPTHELVRDGMPPGSSLLDMGVRRLKDLGRPETVYQLLHPDLPFDFPPLRSLDNPDLKHNLPQQLTSFVGREKELAEIRNLTSSTRLLTLTGSGGTGKTRLALQAAADLLDIFEDGGWLVELAPITEPGLLPQTVAGVLSIKEEAGKSLTQALTDYLRTRSVFLVLDNCEHLLDACAPFAEALLQQCPKVMILATSREGLGIAGETTYRVPSLSLPDPRVTQTADSLPQYEAVRLFIDRAAQIQTTFVVTNQNALALASVCFRLDGIPLAIELAAARVRSLSVEEINARLDQRFRLLTGGSRTALPRHQTLRSMIDWSYDLLSEFEKLMLCRLSVFAGGWTLDAAEVVCTREGIEEWEALDLLTSLVDKSLVAADPKSGVTRYRLLETVRQYTRELLLERGESSAVRERHRDYFLVFVEDAAAKLMGSGEVQWLQRLEDEHENLRAALDWSLKARQQEKNEVEDQYTIPDTRFPALQLCGALARFWSTRGHISEGREWCRRALSCIGAQEPTPDRARVLNAAGTMAYSQGDTTLARAYIEDGLAVRRQIGDPSGIASSLNNLGNVADDRGDYASARAYHEESLAIRRQIEDRRGIASSLNNLGNIAGDQCDYTSARAYHEESLAIKREIGDLSGIATTLNNLGNIADEQGDYESAIAYHEESLAIKRETGDRNGMATTLNNLGNVAADQGNYTSARAYHQGSLAIKIEIGDRNGIGASLEAFAGFALKGSRFELAAVLWGASAALREQIGSVLPPNMRGYYDKNLAEARKSLGDEAFSAAWANGRSLTMEQAIAVALESKG